MNLTDFSPAPNQGGHPELYETENRAVDPGNLVLDALAELAPWRGRTLVDLGCGSGFWLAAYADAAEVIGVEPDPELVPLAAARPGGARVLHGSAEHIPLPDASVDVVHARFAYFWPPRCEPGLREALRVLRPGGTLVVIDNDWRNGRFAELLRACAGSAAMGSGDRTDSWWAEHGAQRTEVRSEWAFESRADFEAVLRMEFPDGTADRWLEQHPEATGLSYGFVLFSVRKG
ncbi:class I SAM-dependent methyltransferase [Streptacidiphilus sp. MAP12-33]|uniref:class I SAM-dependent methyltransferase n=1 Tax=Streptacidiphilus sp. MAP12-33 TaxID=3156266 RepID=UPI0035126AD3